MSDRPLDPGTLEALRAVLAAHEAPAVDDRTWAEMLRVTFTADSDALTGDAAGEHLVPPAWPEPTGDAEHGAPEAAYDDSWPGDDGWSGTDVWPDPGGDAPPEHDSDGGDLT
jgi:hypothetical protein